MSRHLGNHSLKFFTRPRAADIGAHFRRRVQLDDCATIPGLGRTQHQALSPDRSGRPCDGSQVSHDSAGYGNASTQLRRSVARLGDDTQNRTSRCVSAVALGLAITVVRAVKDASSAARLRVQPSLRRGPASCRCWLRFLDAAAPDEQGRLADAVTGLSIAAFAIVQIVPTEAVRTLGTARELLVAAK